MKKNLYNLQAFAEEVKAQLPGYLPEEYEGAMVSIADVVKNNETLTAITVAKHRQNVAPTIYIDSYWEQYKKGKEMEAILEEIAEIRISHDIPGCFDASSITSFENIQEKIIPALIGVEGNEKFLGNLPSTNLEDMAVIYKILVEDEPFAGKGRATVTVTNEILESWKVTKEEIHELALKNMDTLTPHTLKGMSEVMMEMMRGGDASEILENLPEEEMMYVASNTSKLGGATALLNEKLMKEAHEKLGDFYVLPSSIHEVLLVPGDKMPPEELKEMVLEVNATQVEPQDRLTNSVYHFDGTLKKVI